MTPEQFREWRTYMGYTLLEAAEALDLSSGAVQSYEAGARPEGRRVIIPRTVELACAALAVGIKKYRGPEARVGCDEVVS
jgi:transcriptional regulator with XRE-family HTH domain